MNNSVRSFKEFLLLWSGQRQGNGIYHYDRWGFVMCYFSHSIQLEVSEKA